MCHYSNKMKQLDVNAALALLSLGNHIPNLFAHEKGAWWIDVNEEDATAQELLSNTSFNTDINLDEWELL